MEFILGILGIIQITFLPGLIVYRLFNIRTNLLDKALIIFGTSLIANYCVIFLLALLGIYTRRTDCHTLAVSKGPGCARQKYPGGHAGWVI
jgi:uncharacterized membrane protein